MKGKIPEGFTLRKLVIFQMMNTGNFWLNSKRNIMNMVSAI